MVAVLLRLRFRVLANTLQRNTVQLVAVILGAVFGFFMVVAAVGGLFLASYAPEIATQAVVVAAGSALVLGWLIVPLLFDGVDQTLDARRLSRFPLRARQVMVATFLADAAWVPGIATTLAALAGAIAWRTHPEAAALAVVTGIVGVATCIVASRLATAVAGTLLRGRGAVRVGIAIIIALVVIGPILAVLTGPATAGARGPRRPLAPSVTAIIDGFGWSPFGAVWSIPGRIVLGEWAAAGAAALIAVATLVLLVVLWLLMLGLSLRVRGDAPVRAVGAGRLGPLGWNPTTPTGAVAARSLIYWFRDSRLAKQLILIPVLPALMLLWWQLFRVDGIAIAIGPVVASLLPLSVFAGLSYDGTAYAAELAAGVRGLHDRLGRAIALLVIAAPATVVIQVVVALVIGRPGDLPAMLGLALGTLLVSVGVVSVSSARIVVPIARAGRNPFSAQAGGATVSIVGSYAVTGITGALTIPVLALVIAALATGFALLGWLALVVGLLLGAGVATGGIVLGGRMLDSSGPHLLERLRLIRD